MDNLTNNLGLGFPEERGWEYKQICVTRVPGYGFGIAVSGGRDNPHFASGDPSIAVSDVLASGPAERLLQVNDRIISVNGISLQNVDYATAVQVLRDSGDTVTLVVKRRTAQHSHSHSASFNGPPLAALGVSPLPAKVTLTKNSKKEDFGIVLGCKLFIKEISSKARDQLINTNQVLEVGDFLTKLNNTNCNDVMSLKEAKKIIDSTKDKLHITVSRDFGFNSSVSHQTQSSISTTGAVNNFYKGDDFLTSSPQSYSNQNLYVQPPTRNPNLNQNGGFEEKLEQNSGPNSLPDEKSNLAPRGRSRGPLSEANLNQLENRNSIAGYGRSKGREEPPRPPPPRAEDYYSTRRQIYEDDPIIQKTKQPIPDARFITFHKEGSVGIRLTGGNFAGIFVTAVQPGSPASLQGLQPGDKILKVNDMDMNGVTREEAVLFLLSLQDRIELIVQFCKEEYDSIVASQKGDSFYIKTHFHYENPAKGEMSFRSGDIFHVIDTLYNGVVGCWQVFRIGRNNQEVQKGIIPNKSRAEELATAQFNATKKEMSANESRGSFFKRRRSSNRRSKSLGKEHWDDILFSDTVSKFPAYERVLLKHPGFTRPVILFGPIADVAREKLLKDFPDKFISPQLDATVEETSSKHKSSTNSNIIRLSAIRDVISTGKHALLDITPNAVERLNYAQMYPIVVFFKAETKMVVKQLRQGLPKSAHKSSKKLLEQCQKLDKVWSHVFSSTITLNDNTDTWYRKVREIIDKQQSNALWMSESKGYDLYSDIYFPQIYLQPRSTSSLPYRQRQSRSRHRKTALSMYSSPQFIHRTTPYTSCYAPYEYYPYMSPVPSQSTLYQENYPNPEESLSDDFLFPMSSLRLSYASSPESDLEHSPGPPTSPGLSGNGTTAGRLTKASSDPSVVMPDCSTTDVLPPYQDSLSSYDSFNKQSNTRIGPNAHDDLKTTLSKIDPAVTNLQNSPSKYGSGPRWEQNVHRHGSKLDLKYGLPPTDQHSMDNSPRNSREMDKESSPMDAVCPRGSVERDMYRYSRSPAKQHVPGKPHMETKTDYGKYSRNNNSSHHPSQPPPEYTRNSHQDLRESSLSIHQQSPLRSPPMHHQNGYDSGPPNHLGPPNGNTYKPVPPPKPKNYKPPYKQGYAGDGMVQPPPVYQHGKSHSNPVDQRNQNMNLSPHHNYYYNSPPNHNSYHTETAMRYPGHYDMAPPYQESPRRHPSISYASRSEITPIAHQHENPYGMEHHPGEILDARPPVVDLQGSREQRGSAFELYRKPVGHNMRGLMDQPAFYGSQPNIAQKLNTSSATNSPKITPKLTKAQSFKHQKSEGFITPKLFRKLSFTRKSRESTPKMNKKLSLQSEPINENQVVQDFNRNAQDFSRPSKRDITSAIVDHKGAVLVNEYWGVSLEVPEGAIPKGQDKQIYFVISDPRLCDNAPPLDLDNGETMLSPLVMCGPQGTEFLKPVILNIPHYANTLPSLGISLKATDSEQDIHTDWDNILLPSNHAANSVAVKVDHF
ncbi:tight junction protein ZO-1 isoform X4 [Anoplophora glabripennis]|uniref:tight junction protein ZO-1 isoform X4 n=1 Tax=Anoplophora glabripennis TaxID=217634 RepID=UPI000874D30D|nr:tight junction protein ZO-1 isoform X4 [Anoplophora glabripennis]